MERSYASRRRGISDILLRSRLDAGKTLEDMAEAIGVSRNTIYNWEHGTGIPNILQMEDWFDAVGRDPIKKLLAERYPSLYNVVWDDAKTDSKKQILVNYINDYMPELIVDELFFMFFGDHGSNADAVMQKCTAYLQIPLNHRQPIAANIYSTYRMAEASDNLNCPDDVKPDMELLKDAVDSGFTAAIHGESGYSIQKK